MASSSAAGPPYVVNVLDVSTVSSPSSSAAAVTVSSVVHATIVASVSLSRPYLAHWMTDVPSTSNLVEPSRPHPRPI